MLSDLGSGLCTLAVALFLFTNQLQIWHIYMLMAISSAFGAFQRPACAAATTLMETMPAQALAKRVRS